MYTLQQKHIIILPLNSISVVSSLLKQNLSRFTFFVGCFFFPFAARLCLFSVQKNWLFSACRSCLLVNYVISNNPFKKCNNFKSSNFKSINIWNNWEDLFLKSFTGILSYSGEVAWLCQKYYFSRHYLPINPGSFYIRLLSKLWLYVLDYGASKELNVKFNVDKCHIVGAFEWHWVGSFQVFTLTPGTNNVHWKSLIHIEVHSIVLSWMLILPYFDKSITVLAPLPLNFRFMSW